MIKNPNDPTDPQALGPSGGIKTIKTPTSYNEPGLPTPPAGWGKVVGFKDTVDNDDEGPHSPDQYK